MPATNLNIEIEQGATFSQVVAAGVAHAGLTPRAVLRRCFGGAVLATFACTIVDVSGNTTVSLTAEQTKALCVPWAAYDERKVPCGVWDLETVNGSTITRTHQGTATLSRRANSA